MSAAAGVTGFDFFEHASSARVHCASCGLFFVAQCPRPGDRVRCTRCSETVEIAARVVRRHTLSSSRGLLPSWTDEGRNPASDAFFFAAVCVGFVAGTLFVVSLFCNPASPSEPPGGVTTQSEPPFGETVKDTGEW